ncbi:MAG: SHOCT domain-containing protein [Thermoleophilia bacterium]|nr:SHOCT domain-containing protein [Thermoleophilia bacterium]
MRRGRRGPGLVGAMARTAVVAGTATAVSGKVARNQQARYEAQQGAAAPAPAAAPPAPPAPAAAEEDPLLVIQKLAALRDQGVLTEEEFTAKKAQILGI